MRQQAGRPGAGGRVGVRLDTRWRRRTTSAGQSAAAARASELWWTWELPAPAADCHWLEHCTLHSGARGPPLFTFIFCHIHSTHHKLHFAVCQLFHFKRSFAKKSEVKVCRLPLISGATPHRSKSSHLVSVFQVESLRCPSYIQKSGDWLLPDCYLNLSQIFFGISINEQNLVSWILVKKGKCQSGTVAPIFLICWTHHPGPVWSLFLRSKYRCITAQMRRPSCPGNASLTVILHGSNPHQFVHFFHTVSCLRKSFWRRPNPRWMIFRHASVSSTYLESVSLSVRKSITLSDFQSLVALLCNSRLWWPHSNASGVPTIPKEVDTITKEVNTLTKEVNTLTKEVDTITKLFSKL